MGGEVLLLMVFQIMQNLEEMFGIWYITDIGKLKE